MNDNQRNSEIGGSEFQTHYEGDSLFMRGRRKQEQLAQLEELRRLIESEKDPQQKRRLGVKRAKLVVTDLEEDIASLPEYTSEAVRQAYRHALEAARGELEQLQQD